MNKKYTVEEAARALMALYNGRKDTKLIVADLYRNGFCVKQNISYAVSLYEEALSEIEIAQEHKAAIFLFIFKYYVTRNDAINASKYTKFFDIDTLLALELYYKPLSEPLGCCLIYLEMLTRPDWEELKDKKNKILLWLFEFYYKRNIYSTAFSYLKEIPDNLVPCSYMITAAEWFYAKEETSTAIRFLRYIIQNHSEEDKNTDFRYSHLLVFSYHQQNNYDGVLEAIKFIPMEMRNETAHYCEIIARESLGRRDQYLFQLCEAFMQADASDSRRLKIARIMLQCCLKQQKYNQGCSIANSIGDSWWSDEFRQCQLKEKYNYLSKFLTIMFCVLINFALFFSVFLPDWGVLNSSNKFSIIVFDSFLTISILYLLIKQLFTSNKARYSFFSFKHKFFWGMSCVFLAWAVTGVMFNSNSLTKFVIVLVTSFLLTLFFSIICADTIYKLLIDKKNTVLTALKGSLQKEIQPISLAFVLVLVICYYTNAICVLLLFPVLSYAFIEGKRIIDLLRKG